MNKQPFDYNEWHQFGKELLQEKGSDEQHMFLVACKKKDTFFSYLEQKGLSGDATVIERSIGPLERKFSEKEFFSPPQDTEEHIYAHFSTLNKETLSSCDFWAYIVIEMIKKDYIKPYYLASKDNGNGLYEIDKALVERNQDHNSMKKTIDDCVRRILRSMCNPKPRGKRIVFNDFSLGKAYWRQHWAHEMTKHTNLSVDTILNLLSAHHYSEFSAKMHSGKSYIGQKNTLAGFLLYLNEKSSLSKDLFIGIIDKLSFLSAWKAIEAQTPGDNKVEIAHIAKTLG